MTLRLHHRILFAAAGASALILTLAAQTDAPMERVLIHASKPYTNVVSRVQAAGGRVRHQFKYVDAVAAEVPRSAVPALRDIAGVSEVSKDVIIPAPQTVQLERGERGLQRGGPRSIAAESATSLDAASLSGFVAAYPDAYLINNANMNVTPLIANGITGAGVIVAEIDSGIRPGFPHLSTDGSVIGGEDFVGDGLGFSNPANGGHGTFVAGMISANVVFNFGATGTFARSVVAHCPTCTVPSTIPGATAIPMLGSAPLASIYALRVFPPTGGAPTSRIVAAIERVIELREMFDAGIAGGVNIQVCNMSLGGPTLFAGRDLLDRTASVLLDKGIVLTVSASNAGPSSLTIGSPGSAFEALTVGASSDAIHERILRDVQFGLGIGALYRPFSGTQTAFF